MFRIQDAGDLSRKLQVTLDMLRRVDTVDLAETMVRRTSISLQAAHWLAENGGTLKEASKRFGVSRQAIQQAWRREYPNQRTPHIVATEKLRLQVVETAQRVTSLKELIAATGVSRHIALKVCHELGITWQKQARR